MAWLSNLPAVITLPLFAVVFAAVAVIIHTLVRRFLPPPERLSEHHEVAGFLVGVVGVLYSVVLGFLVGAVWTNFSTAQQTADLEAGYVGDAFNYARQFPLSQRRPLQRLIAQYAVVVKTEDWSKPSTEANDLTAQLLAQAVHIITSPPPTPANAGAAQVLESSALQSSLLNSLRSIGDSRRLRIVQSSSHLPAGMLEALVLGAVFVVAFTFFFGVRSYAKQMTMTALLAASIGLFFGLIIELSQPYSGGIAVSREAWSVVIAGNHLEAYAR
jgi:uncharacterized protein YacL